MIKLTTRIGNKTVYVNPKLVTSILVTDFVALSFGAHNFIEVKESEDEVVAKLYSAELDKYTRTGDYSRL